ncbi:MAG: flagellar hook capping FlgD N-terminal domain-containing protein [Aliidongia sp.]|jgi:flagellar basal-body rod modification protein FlgD
MSLITETNKISQQAATVQNALQTNGLLPTTGPTTASAAASGSSANSSGLTTTNAGVQSEFNTFLTLLTTQLQNQDPTSPLDTNQFTSQLVQFSQLEQQLDTNANLQTLISGQTTSTVGTAIGYIGHTVEASGGNFVLDGTDSDDLSYNLSSAAASTTINILNSNGQTVAQIPGTSTAGANEVSYDGTSPGQPSLPPGQYSFTVTSVDASGNVVPSTVFTSGVVTGVDNSNGTVNLSIGNLIIPASSVIQVTS